MTQFRHHSHLCVHTFAFSHFRIWAFRLNLCIFWPPPARPHHPIMNHDCRDRVKWKFTQKCCVRLNTETWDEKKIEPANSCIHIPFSIVYSNWLKHIISDSINLYVAIWSGRNQIRTREICIHDFGQKWVNIIKFSITFIYGCFIALFACMRLYLFQIV